MKKFLVVALLLTLVAPAVFAQVRQKVSKRTKPVNEESVVDPFHDPHALTIQNNLRRTYLESIGTLSGEYLLRLPNEEEADVLGSFSPAELEETYAVITDINQLRSEFIASKMNDRALLEKVVAFYDSLALNLATNPEEALLGSNFVAKNEKQLQLLCKFANQPMKTGWGKNIVLSAYVAEGQELVRTFLMSEESGLKLAALSNLLGEDKAVKLEEPSMTEQEARGKKEVLELLANIRANVAAAREENPLATLQAFGSLYRTMAGYFAANQDISSSFQAKNPELVKWLAKEMQRPMKVGWAKNKKIVMGQYIADNLPEAYIAWHASDAADELDTFNRDVLLGARN